MATAPFINYKNKKSDYAIYNQKPMKIEEIPEVILSFNKILSNNLYKMIEVSYYTNFINNELEKKCNIKITADEYISMIDRFIRYGDSYYQVVLNDALKSKEGFII